MIPNESKIHFLHDSSFLLVNENKLNRYKRFHIFFKFRNLDVFKRTFYYRIERNI